MKKDNKKAVCLISGGLDSTVAAAVAKKKEYDLYFLFCDYGQKTVARERALVKTLVRYFDARQLQEVKIPWIKKFGGSALLDPKIPLNEKNFLKEYVPFRNSQFLAIATAWAEVLGAGAIFVGSSGGDHICPDNSRSFINSFQKVIKEGTMMFKNIQIIAPLLATDKTGAVKIGKKLRVPFELTWSCHNRTDKACGHCSNCRSRIEAFGLNGMKDPIKYV